MTPEPPVNVRIVRPDGTEIPCEIRYEGERTADDGEVMHDWVALSEYALDVKAGDVMKMDKLPARTGLSFMMRGGPDWKGTLKITGEQP